MPKSTFMDAKPSRKIGFRLNGEYPFIQIKGSILCGMSGFGGDVIGMGYLYRLNHDLRLAGISVGGALGWGREITTGLIEPPNGTLRRAAELESVPMVNTLC
jgi:hypothetical protein